MNETNDLLEGVADQLRELRLQAGLKGQQLADQHDHVRHAAKLDSRAADRDATLQVHRRKRR